MKKIILSIFLTLVLSTGLYAQDIFTPPTVVSELDGSPSGVATSFLLPNGSLSITGSVATLTYGSGSGDVTSGANITDNAVVRGDGGAKGIQESTATIDDSGVLSVSGIETSELTVTDGSYPNNIKVVNEAGLGSRLTVGLNATGEKFVLAPYALIDNDLGLTDRAVPSFAITDNDASHVLEMYVYGSTAYLINTAGSNGSFNIESDAGTIHILRADLAAGSVFDFAAGVVNEITDSNGRQAWMLFRPNIKQTGTAAYDGIYLNATLTSVGDGSTGDGNNLLNLAVSGTSQFRVEESAGLAAGETALWLYDDDNGQIEQVTVGIADSGGAGFKVLRIPN